MTSSFSGYHMGNFSLTSLMLSTQVLYCPSGTGYCSSSLLMPVTSRQSAQHYAIQGHLPHHRRDTAELRDCRLIQAHCQQQTQMTLYMFMYDSLSTRLMQSDWVDNAADLLTDHLANMVSGLRCCIQTEDCFTVKPGKTTSSCSRWVIPDVLASHF